jgi:D-alanyl-lipoteichoic acid acyltransferase DltB (MBOAT superfamily)
LVAVFIVGAAVTISLTSSDAWVSTLASRLVLLPLAGAGGIALHILKRNASDRVRLRIGKGLVVFLLLLFVLLKSFLGQPLGIVGWIGFSYITFRLLHVLFERLGGRDTGHAAPSEMLLYTLFFPALLIGPIDRLPRFLSDVRGPSLAFEWSKLIEGVIRIFIGGVKKFLLADLLLSHLALTGASASDLGTAYAWVQFYASAFYLFLDFSGFTDIAIGMGLLLGYALPDNFNNPYAKNNLAQFWQSWHITLSNWLRTYVFLPLSRSLLRTRLGRSPTLVVFCAHMTTMLSIGLWHGITLNFALWGLWHGFGLFIQKVFADRTRRRQMTLKQNTAVATVMNGAGILVTFHFVALGWVFFMLGTPAESMAFLLRLVGR